MKKAFALILSVLMVLSLAACSQSAPSGGSSGGQSTPSQSTPSQSGGTDAAEPAKVDFPTKTITLICPYAAGGQSDMICRTVADKMGELLGQAITVVNTPGAGGSVGWGWGAGGGWMRGRLCGLWTGTGRRDTPWADWGNAAEN